MTNKCREEMFTLLAIREIQIKIPPQFHLTPEKNGCYQENKCCWWEGNFYNVHEKVN